MPAFGQNPGSGGSPAGGPAPWWQLPGQAANQQNLQNSAPNGYEYDSVKMKYARTPDSVGDRAGAAIDALRKRVPDLFNPNQSGSFSSSSGPMLPFPPGGGGGGNIPRVQAPDTSAAEAAAFARAKDRVGQSSRGALTALQQTMGARGQLGGSQGRRGEASVINQGQAQLADTSRELAIQDAERQRQFALAGYQGDITQRGQDISAGQNANEMALKVWLAQQEQARSYAQQQSQSVAGLLGAFGNSLY